MSDDYLTSVETFLAYAIKLEEEATLRFGQLADAMDSYGNKDVGRIFRKLSDYSRMHLGEARARAGFRDVPTFSPDLFQWPDLESPETAAIWATDPLIARHDAFQIALESEKLGHDFYQSVVDQTSDPEIRVLAKEFAEEEAEHVAALKKWMAEEEAGQSFSEIAFTHGHG